MALFPCFNKCTPRIFLSVGVRDANGHDIIVIDASRLPVNKNLSDKKEADEVARSLTSYVLRGFQLTFKTVPVLPLVCVQCLI